MTVSHRRVRLVGVATGLALGAGIGGAPSSGVAATGSTADVRLTSARCGAPAPSWVAAWALATNNTAAGYDKQSVRVVVEPKFTGGKARIRLSNALGEQPVTLSTVHIGRVEDGATLVPGSNRPLEFDGASKVTIPAGKTVLSDAARLKVRSFKPVAVSFYAPVATGPSTGHNALATTYVADGKHAGDASGAAYGDGTSGGRFVSAVDVFAPNDGAIVAFGDSITQGVSVDAAIQGAAPYTETLARRLHKWARNGGPKLSIVNLGISGNRVRTDGTGPAAVKRLRYDVLRQSGLDGVIMMEGINDLNYMTTPGGELPSVRQMAKAYNSIIRRVHRAGADMWLSPLTPAGDTRRPTPFGHSATPEQVERRHQINRWIRAKSGVYDGRVDFDPIVKDPQNPNWLAPEYESGDNLHPNNAGLEAMGRSIGLRALKGLGCN